MAAFEVKNYSNLYTTKIADVPNYTFNNITYTSIGGFGIGKLKNSMFVLKASSAEQMANFYYFPEIDEPEGYGVYRLRYAGHANAMAVTDSYIYVTGWASNEENKHENNVNNNWVIRIPRKTIAAMGLTKTGEIIPKDDYSTEGEEGLSVLYPKVKNVNADGTVTYTPYTKPIRSITKYKSNNSFLIGYKVDSSLEYLGFTKAKVEIGDGKRYFVVSENLNDSFVIKNSLSYKGAGLQDIFYSEESGLLFPAWYGQNDEDPNYNPVKNVILWANIDGNSSGNVTIGNKTYRVYNPAKINVNMGLSTYDKFEIESLAFDQDNDLLFSANVKLKSNTYETDAVYKLTRNDGLKFTIS